MRSVAGRLGAYALVLAAAVGGGAVLGGVAGPIEVADGAGHEMGSAPAPSPAPEPGPAATGPEVSPDGYRLRIEDRVLDGGALAFEVLDPGGEPVVELDPEAGREVRVVLVTPDLTRAQVLDARRHGRSRWTADAGALPPGPYRAFVDVRPRGASPQSLAADVEVVAPTHRGGGTRAGPPPREAHQTATSEPGTSEPGTSEPGTSEPRSP